LTLVFWAIGDGTEINKGYIGEQYTDYWVFRAAEFLDCRTHKSILFADKRTVIEEILPKLVPSSATAIRRTTAIQRRNMSDEERFLEGSQANDESALMRECKLFMTTIIVP
jgi:hypothetical protein